MSNASVHPVVIIGAGPTGLTAATLLGQYGIDCLVLDRWQSVYPQPRAVHLDDEIYRLLARLGVREQFAAISWACRGLRLMDRNLRVLAEFERRTERGKHGYPEANMFDQPEFEGILRGNLERYTTISVRSNSEVTGVTQADGGPVRVDVVDRVSGLPETILAEYVLGCDGANSVTRGAMGARMQDLKFTQRWLVVDVGTEADLQQWEGVHQVCDPIGAATFMRVGSNRYRWEFRLRPDESADRYRDINRLYPRLRPWTGDLPLEQLAVMRAAEYTFRARIADRWRDRRVFLLGDAAHLTPPFIGQGLCAGMRDAANLAWKLAGVLDGCLPASVLDTYQTERKPHARAMIERAKLIGRLMTEGGRWGNLLRRAIIPRLHLLPGFENLILSPESPRLRPSALVARPRSRGALAGKLCPNALLEDMRRFDEGVSGRFALVTRAKPTPALQSTVEQRGAVLVAATPGTYLAEWLRRGHAFAAIVRPDGTVLRTARDPLEICQSMPAFSLARSSWRAS